MYFILFLVDENKILIRNVSENEVEAILMYYENEKRSGGGSVRTREYVNDSKLLMIEYNDPECVERTVKFGEVRVNGRSYRAEKFKKEIPLNRNKSVELTRNISNGGDNFSLKLIIYKIDANDKFENIEDNIILLYIELLLKHSNFRFFKISYGLEDFDLFQNTSQYVVISDEALDFDKIKIENQKRSKLMDRIVMIENLKDNGCIIVFTKEHPDLVELHFSNQKRSGGGDIKTFKKFDKFCLIEFEDKSCVNRILNNNNQKEGMKVERFYEDSKEFELKYISAKKGIHVLRSLEIDISEFPFSFIIKSRKQVEIFREYLKRYEVNLIEKIDDGQLAIEYSSARLSNQKLDECMQEFKKNYLNHEWIIESDVFLKLKPKLLSFYADQNNLILNFYDMNGSLSKIHMAGSADIVKGEIIKIDTIINDDQNRKIEDKVTNLKRYQCSLLLKLGFIALSKQTDPDLSILIAPPNNTVTIKGFLQSVLWCKQEMYSQLNSLIYKECEISCLLGKFFKSSIDYVETEFDKQNFTCEFEVVIESEIQLMDEKQFLNGKCKLTFYGREEAELIKANKFMEQNFVVYKYNLDEESVELLDKQYQQFLERITEDLKKTKEQENIIFVSSKAIRKVWCVGEKKLVGRLSIEIKDFFEANTMLMKYCDSFNLEELKYLNVVKSKEIPNICIKLHKETNCLVVANFETDYNNDLDSLRLRITGTKKTLERLIQELRDIINKKIERVIELTDESVNDLFLNERGRRTLNNIENQTQCLILQTIESANNDLKERRQNPVPVYCYEDTQGFKIQVVNSTIDKFENADVITIGAYSKLQPFDEASRLTIAKGGQIILDGIEKYFYSNEEKFEGEVHSIALADDNFCKSLAFAIVPKSIDNTEIIFLKKCIDECLKRSKNYKSIAFPLFYNGEKVDESMMKMIILAIVDRVVNFFF